MLRQKIQGVHSKFNTNKRAGAVPQRLRARLGSCLSQVQDALAATVNLQMVSEAGLPVVRDWHVSPHPLDVIDVGCHSQCEMGSRLQLHRGRWSIHDVCVSRRFFVQR